MFHVKHFATRLDAFFPRISVFEYVVVRASHYARR
jgi:hypothetical protein